ncbi:MAG: hypothetical protein HY680_00860, partial [Chloroflexi bacterium]|nr:hypothetical protein [Chloroflexota bacterium]
MRGGLGQGGDLVAEVGILTQVWRRSLSTRHLLSITDLSPVEIGRIIQRAMEMKLGPHSQPLAGKSIALLFEKPSLRTKVSFDVGIQQLGGHAIYMGRDEVGLGGREPVADVARVLSRYVDAVV